MIKRPITLLCLSDLHLVPKESSQAILTSLRSAIKKQIYKNARWRPDYVVCSGDMVEASRKDYKTVNKYIESFINDQDFHLHPFKIIAVPGNHDKDFPFLSYSCKRFSSELAIEHDKNRSFITALKSDKPFEFDMKAHFKDNFKSFGDFYKDYVTRCYYQEGQMLGEYDFPHEYLGDELSNIALTSGLKVFHDSKICFLCVNTEWVYLPDKYADKEAVLQLCTPVIYSSLKRIQQYYNDYTIITVMHRNPSEFSWEARNRVERNKPDILRYLYHYSDIILTGHEHIEKVLPPHMMENHAQLFQLGSASVESRNNNSVSHYLAALMYIDPVEGNINVCNFRYNGLGPEWEASIDPNTYHLAHNAVASHLFVPSQAPSVLANYPSTTVSVKSFEKDDAIMALRNRFAGIEEAGYSIHCLSVNDKDLLNSIRNIRILGGKNALFLYTLSTIDHEKFIDIQKELYSQKEFRRDVYMKMFILSEVRFVCHDPEKEII